MSDEPLMAKQFNEVYNAGRCIDCGAERDDKEQNEGGVADRPA